MYNSIIIYIFAIKKLIMNYYLSKDEKTLITVSKDIVEFIIPNTVTKIDTHAFNKCQYLKSIIIPDNVTEIGSGAFSSCKNLTNVKISKNVSKIMYWTFAYCNNLKYIDMPHMKEIQSCSLYGCENLININSSLCEEQIMEAFSSVVINGNIHPLKKCIGDGYEKYLQRNREYKLNMLENEL